MAEWQDLGAVAAQHLGFGTIDALDPVQKCGSLTHPKTLASPRPRPILLFDTHQCHILYPYCPSTEHTLSIQGLDSMSLVSIGHNLQQGLAPDITREVAPRLHLDIKLAGCGPLTFAPLAIFMRGSVQNVQMRLYQKKCLVSKNFLPRNQRLVFPQIPHRVRTSLTAFVRNSPQRLDTFILEELTQQFHNNVPLT